MLALETFGDELVNDFLSRHSDEDLKNICSASPDFLNALDEPEKWDLDRLKKENPRWAPRLHLISPVACAMVRGLKTQVPGPSDDYDEEHPFDPTIQDHAVILRDQLLSLGATSEVQIPYDVICVIDGHNGHQCARLAGYFFHPVFQAVWEKMSSLLEATCRHHHDPVALEEGLEDLIRVTVRHAFSLLDQLLCGFHQRNSRLIPSGAVMLAALSFPRFVVIASLGDSRAYLIEEKRTQGQTEIRFPFSWDTPSIPISSPQPGVRESQNFWWTYLSNAGEGSGGLVLRPLTRDHHLDREGKDLRELRRMHHIYKHNHHLLDFRPMKESDPLADKRLAQQHLDQQLTHFDPRFFPSNQNSSPPPLCKQPFHDDLCELIDDKFQPNSTVPFFCRNGRLGQVLAVTGALGDFSLETPQHHVPINPFLRKLPDLITIRKPEHHFAALLLCSDGLLNEKDGEQLLCDTIQRHLQPWLEQSSVSSPIKNRDASFAIHAQSILEELLFWPSETSRRPFFDDATLLCFPLCSKTLKI